MPVLVKEHVLFLARLKGLILVKFHFEYLHSAYFNSPEFQLYIVFCLPFALTCQYYLDMTAFRCHTQSRDSSPQPSPCHVALRCSCSLF